MIRPVCALAVAVLALAPTLSRADTRSIVSKAFGNTVISTYQDGRKGYTWLKADGTYTGEGRHKDRSNGRWRIAGERLCFKQDHPVRLRRGVLCTGPAVGLRERLQEQVAVGRAHHHHHGEGPRHALNPRERPQMRTMAESRRP